MGESVTRVERRRQATIDEIVAAARCLLKADEEVTVSSVAAALDLTPPALYRYISNLAGLHDLVAKSILTTLRARLDAAAARHEEPAARLVAAATAFRQWALLNPNEFRTVFRPRPPFLPQTPSEVPSASEIANTLFAELALDVMTAYPVAPRSNDFVPTAFFEKLDADNARTGFPPGMDPWIFWQFQKAWVKFLGIIAYETYGFLRPSIIVSGDLCVAILVDIGIELGLTADIERLIEVAVDTADWTNELDGTEPFANYL